VYHCLCYRVVVCCGAVYKSESCDLILIDVAKFKPCLPRLHGNLAHVAAVARDVFVSSSYNSPGSSSTQDSYPVSQCYSKPGEEAVLLSSTSVTGEREDRDDEYDDESYSVLQTDESMDAASPSRDTDDEADMLPASTMAVTGRSIFCNLLWNSTHNRPFGKSADLENQPNFIWPQMQPQSVTQ